MIKHLACIMDGNRRWARKQGLALLRGHRAGAETIKVATQFCLKKNIPYLSLYAFSIENFKRPEEEKQYLFQLLEHEASNQIKEFLDNNIRVFVIGDKSQFPTHIQDICKRIEDETAHCTALQINFLFGYGGRQEIVHSFKAIAHDLLHGRIALDDINETLVYKNLWLGSVPEPELIIRTGNVQRLSNFLLYEAAYSELYFFDCMWPEMTEAHFEQALAYYEGTQRRFGL